MAWGVRRLISTQSRTRPRPLPSPGRSLAVDHVLGLHVQSSRLGTSTDDLPIKNELAIISIDASITRIPPEQLGEGLVFPYFIVQRLVAPSVLILILSKAPPYRCYRLRRRLDLNAPPSRRLCHDGLVVVALGQIPTFLPPGAWPSSRLATPLTFAAAASCPVGVVVVIGRLCFFLVFFFLGGDGFVGSSSSTLMAGAKPQHHHRSRLLRVTSCASGPWSWRGSSF